jgi:hypothetical protein
MVKSHEDFFKEYVERFSSYSDLEIVATFNGQVGNPGWCTARSGYLFAIRHELDRRNINRDDVSEDGGISYAERVSLYVINGQKIIKRVG